MISDLIIYGFILLAICGTFFILGLVVAQIGRDTWDDLWKP